MLPHKEQNGRFLHRPQQDYPAATVADFCTAVLTAGWGAIAPYPVDYRTGRFSAGIGWGPAGNLDVLNIAIKEWVGRMAYRLAGR